MHRTIALAALATLLSGSVAASGEDSIGEQRARLTRARQAADAARRRADALARSAANERRAASRAQAEEQTLAARVDAAAADVAAADARRQVVDQMLQAQRRRLARTQAPVTRLLGAIEALARRPAIVTIAQPGSVEDLVRMRAVLGTALPIVRARGDVVRRDIDRVRQLAAASDAAAVAQRNTRGRLEASRVALAKLEAEHRRRGQQLDRGAMSEEDRALALGEQARDLVEQMDQTAQATTTGQKLAALAGPLPRPLAPGAVAPPHPRGVYRLPVEGTLVTGFGELSDAGVRARGLTFAVALAALVRAPAGGTVRYAGPFRDYGIIVVIDHADGWSTLVTGLGSTAVRRGQPVAAGAPIGRAGRGDSPTITVELRRRGRPVDLVQMLG